jgi:hypothetical protein
MHRDPTLRKRNALVIPGVLLVLACLVGILYAQVLRSDEVLCEDGREVFFIGACRSATLLLVIPLAIGGLLIGVGASMRSKTTCHLGHGTTSTTILAILIAAVALTAVAAVGLYVMDDPDAPYVLTVGEVDYGLPRLLGGVAAALGFLALLPYLLLYLFTARPPACCRAKACFEPCYCDEAAEAPPIPAFPPPAVEHPAETAQVTTSPWPPATGTPRTRPSLVPISAPLVPQEPVAPAPDAPQPEPAADPWPAPTNDFATGGSDTWPAAPEAKPEPASDAWPAAAAPASDPWPGKGKAEPAWTPPAPVEEEEDEAPAKGSSAKGKPKAAKGKTAPKTGAKKTTRKVTGKKKT